MPSLVAEFIINPVIRQARRLSERASPRDYAQQQPDPDCTTTAALTPSTSSTSESTASLAEDHATTIQQDEQTPSPLASPVSSDSQNAAESRRRSPTRHSPRHFPQNSTAAVPTSVMATPSSTRRSLPEDDGMGDLRKRLIAIQSHSIASPEEKARLMHETLMEGYRLSQTTARISIADPLLDAPVTAGEAWEKTVAGGALDALKFWQNSPSETASSDRFILSAEDIKPTYVPLKPGKTSSQPTDDETQTNRRPLGCQHYRRNVKLQCSTCAKWYTCRFCHDANENHELIRKETKNMLCMLCACPQKAAESCINCGIPAARYFCNICKLWDDHPNKNIYHCNDCGICRRGQGLGKDFFHCKKCCACISISIKETHKCIERSTDCDCPICGEYMFTSPKPVVFMVCGHSIHARCYDEHMRRSYKCPICNKSLLNMETQFRQLELEIQAQPMPPEFQDTKAVVLCNDCSGKSTVPYHWLGLKCAICNSYNTAELQISGRSPTAPAARGQSRSNNNQVTSNMPASAPRPLNTGAADTANRLAVPIGPRHRRFSSLAGPEVSATPRRIADDRLARSSSPPSHIAGQAPSVPWPVPDLGLHDDPGADSDEDIVRFWGSRFRGSSDDGSESGSEDGDEEEEEDDDEEDDEDDEDYNDIMLIGHR